MAYRFRIQRKVHKEVRRAAIEQIDKAIEELHEQRQDIHKAIHEVRKRLKKVRAVLRLVRPELSASYARQNALFRDLGRKLAKFRDAEARVEAVEGLIQQTPEQEREPLQQVRSQLAAKRDEQIRQAGDLPDLLDAVGRELESAKRNIKRWKFSGQEFGTLAGGLRKTYARGRKALTKAYRTNTSEDFHEWRKRVKYHWYHMRLVRECWDKPMNARRDELSELADVLGDDHDLAVLEQTLADFGGGDGNRNWQPGARIHRRQAKLRAKARPLGERIFAEKPKRFVDRMSRYWKSHRS
jgi:CHAD domain-containing protein